LSENIAIEGAACAFPDRLLTIEQVFEAEELELTDETSERLGIDTVAARQDESGAELAVAAARQALEAAAIEADSVSVILDCTTSPQDFLAPAWNMSNQVQHDLGAKNAFTVGFSGSGTTGLLVAIDFATSLLATDESLSSALIVASETPIADHRVLDRDRPVTLFGDGAGALVLQRGGDGPQLLATELATDGAQHDACYIPGGAMKHPLREDLYAPTLDREAYEAARSGESVRRLTETLCQRHCLDAALLTKLVAPNYSPGDDTAFAAGLGLETVSGAEANRRAYGHVHATDLILNWLAAEAETTPGDHVLFGSHGCGYTAGATLVRC